MSFLDGALRVFDRTGRPLGDLTRVTVTAPRSYRLSEVEDMSFRIPRNDGDEIIITASDTPPYVGSSTAQNTTTTTTPITPHANVLPGDVLLVVAAYDITGGARNVTPPDADWLPVLATIGGGSDFGVKAWVRRVLAGETSYTFTTTTIAPVIYSSHAYRNAYKIGPFEVIAGTASGTAWPFPQVFAPHGKEYLIQIVAGNTAGAWTVPGSTALSEQSITGVSMDVCHRVVERGMTTVASATAAPAMIAITASLIVQEMPSVEALLARDNLVYVENDISMPGWAGVLEDVTYGDGAADARLPGTLSLLGGLDISMIEAEETEAAEIAERIVAAVNAKKVVSGDLQIGFVRDGSVINHGTFSHEGDALAAINALARDSLSDFYMRSYIDPVTGYLRTDLHWGAEYDFDHTDVVIRDGVEGNLAQGSQFNFSSADSLSYARLIGAQTNASQFVHYGSVANAIREVSPTASLFVPTSDTPNNRRREAASFSVDWGLPESQQRALAEQVEAKYLDLYKRFLYAYHDRWGSPFLDGFDWAGPKPGEIASLSMTYVTTVMQMGFLNMTSIVSTYDMERDAEVSLTELRFKHYLDTADAIGVALDYASVDDRLIATSSGTVARIDPRTINNPTADLAYREIVRVTRTGETLVDIATDAAKSSSVWALLTTSTSAIVREFDLESWAILTEWSAPEALPGNATAASTGLAIDVLRGKVFILDNASGGNFAARIVERELANGRLIRTPVTLPNTGYQQAVIPIRAWAISFSGDVLYVAHNPISALTGTSQITMYLADPDGSLSGTTYAEAGEMHLGFAARGIYTDPWHSEIWFPLPDGRIGVYFASVAVAVTEGNRVSDGAPGFDQITRGTFVRIIYRDSRVGYASSPSAYRPKHICQFGRPVGGVWTKWGTKFDSVNCTMAAAAMALARHTEGKKTATPVQMRTFSSDTSGGSNMEDIKRAWRIGWGETLTIDYYAKFSRLVQLLKAGRGVVVQGDWDQIPKAYTCQAGFTGNHAVYINEVRANGDFLVYDPICAVGRDSHDKSPKWIPQKYIFRYGQKFTGRSGTIHIAYTRDTTSTSVTTVSAKPAGYFGDWPGPAGVEKIMWALGKQESDLNYCMVNGGTGAYGKYQILPANLATWGRTYIRKDGRLCCNTPLCTLEQDHIARGKLSDLYQAFDRWDGKALTATKTWRRVAYWWLTLSNLYPESKWSDFQTRYVNSVMAHYAKAPKPSSSTAPIVNGRAYIVWSQGWYEDEILPGDAPGDPARIEKRWVPVYENTPYGSFEGEWPKSGFRDDVALAHPEQVIYGEESRVNDWDPVTMGYGENGYSFYRNIVGDTYRSKGWYLRPWDLPASYFWFDEPDWPTGEEYLRRLIDKANREQAAQALNVINRDGLWTKIELGGRYTVKSTEQGPKPEGITGVVRVVGFSPDEPAGAMQLLTEGLA